MENTIEKKEGFTRYQKLIIFILAFVQFTVVLDFMVLSPLGEQLLRELHINTKQFGLLVASYAFSAGISGILSAGFADKYDRKKFLLFFYAGFLIGTLLCGIAPNYYFLLFARIITGIFGGVISSVSFAIITDLFALEKRGRVMGFVQSAFALSQVIGIPVGLYLASEYGWHSPFLTIVTVSFVVGVLIMIFMKPIIAHLENKTERKAFAHLLHTLTRRNYIKGFAATALLATGGFMLMPFGSTFSLHNLKITNRELQMVYFFTGLCAGGFGPLTGLLADKIGKFKVFWIGSAWSMTIIAIYTQLGVTPVWVVIVVSVLLFIGISSRMITASALMSAVPEPQDRGAFMGINSSVQQLSGGIASIIAGLIVVQAPDKKLLHYDTLGYVVIVAMVITIGMMFIINLHIQHKLQKKA